MSFNKNRDKNKNIVASLRQNPWILISALSFLANIFFIWHINHQPSLPNLGYPKFLNLNKPLSCENTQIEESELPLCPKGSGRKILPPYYPIHSAFIGYQKGMENTGFFQNVMRLFTEGNNRAPLILLTPRDQLESTEAEVNKYINIFWKQWNNLS